MSVAFYMDVNVEGAVTKGLRRRGVDVLTAQEDGRDTAADSDLLDRATALLRPVFTHDPDFLREAARRQQTGERFAGVIFIAHRTLSINKTIADLEVIAGASNPPDLENRVEYLPL